MPNPASRPQSRHPGASRDPAPSRTPPIEIDARSKPPLGTSPAQFLKTYWQKHPVLLRNAFPRFESPITPNDLAGLACEPLASARMVMHDAKRDRWTLKQGPFTEKDFTRTPKTHWTLLVQDCDKLIAEIDALLDAFSFVPRFRLDDVMVSYAAPGGSVGAHVDQYDVFLLQGFGSRRWQISTDAHASPTFRDDAELKLLREFTPTHEWTLAPGDMLYLPPGVPHHGVAIDDCLTYSIGMRAPSAAELALDLAEHVVEQLPEEWRYTDPDLAPAKSRGEIPADAIRRAVALAEQALAGDEAQRAEWFGRFITRYRSAHAPMPAAAPIDVAALRHALKRGDALHRSPWSRYAWARVGRAARCFFAGDSWSVSLQAARVLDENARLGDTDLSALTAADWQALTEQLNAGHWVLARD